MSSEEWPERLNCSREIPEERAFRVPPCFEVLERNFFLSDRHQMRTGRSISGWIPSLKTGSASHVRQPFCSQLEERLLLWLEYHPQGISYARGDIGPPFATAYRLPIPKHAPFAIGYAFEGKPHDYLPDVVGTLTNGKTFIAETGMEDDKRQDRNLAKAEAARRLARLL